MKSEREKISSQPPARQIHVWVPGLYVAKGGIETYSAFLLRALEEASLESRLEVFSKLDHPGSLGSAPVSRQTRFHCAGSSQPRTQTLRFVSQISLHGLRRRPDLIITTHLNFAPVAHRLKQLIGTPFWVVAHGVEAWGTLRPRLRSALCEADRVLAVSSYTREHLLAEQGLDVRKVVIQPNTVDETRFSIAPKPQTLLVRYGLESHQPVILTVARLASGEQYKGYDQVIRALPAIRQKVPDVRYVIVGKGDDRGRVEELIADLGLEDCVTLAGFVPDEELCEHYNLCDVFAMPSKGEGFGIVYLEALACGKPVVAGNADASPEALGGGRLGAVVDPDDVQQIAETLTAILRREYPKPIIYEPERLRSEMLDLFGFERFKQTLTAHLNEFYCQHPQRLHEGVAVKG